MRYSNIREGRFLSRPNRFIAQVEVEGEVETVHVKNTGRCAELLYEGARVWLYESSNPARKTRFDLVAVEKADGRVVNIDSQIANDTAGEWLRKGLLFTEHAVIRREVKQGSSRFDFMVEDEGRISFLEVKGVTLEREGIAYFPDAPTERGVKHLKELADCAGAGYGAYVLFVIQMKGITELKPNDDTHKAFGDALRDVAAAGVKILALDCKISPDCIEADQFIPVLL